MELVKIGYQSVWLAPRHDLTKLHLKIYIRTIVMVKSM